MTTYPVWAAGYNPYWPADALGLTDGSGTQLSSVPAGVAFVTSPAHPFASTESERWLEFDGNTTTHQVGMRVAAADSRHFSDALTRFAHRWSWLYRTTATGPTANAMIWSCNGTLSGATAYGIEEETSTRKVRLTVGGVLVATSTAALPTDTNMQLEVWAITKNSAGASLGGSQWVVRYTTGFGGALTTTTLINVFTSDAAFGTGTTWFNVFGETTARGAGWKFYVGNALHTMEDADAPWGIIRFDRLDVNGDGHTQNGSPIPAGTHYTTVDETGTAVPSDTDYVTLGGSAGLREFMALTSPAYCKTVANSDLPIVVLTNGRYQCGNTGAKGANAKHSVLISNGASDYAAPFTDAGAGTTWVYLFTQQWLTDQADARWVDSTLASLQTGWGTDTSNNVTMWVSAMVTLVVYQKSGEGLAALPASPNVTTRAAPSGTLQGMSMGVY